MLLTMSPILLGIIIILFFILGVYILWALLHILTTLEVIGKYIIYSLHRKYPGMKLPDDSQ